MVAKVSKKRAEKTVMPQIQNVAELRGVSRKGLLIHFTAEQWKAATKGMGRLKPGPRSKAALEAAPVPGRPGDFVIGPKCPPGCTPVMRYQRAAKRRPPRPGKTGSPVGYTPHPDDFIIPECICDPDEPDLPGGGQGGLNRSGCRLVIRFQRQRPPRAFPTPVITCDRTTCTRNCRLASRRLPDGRIEIFCDCRA